MNKDHIHESIINSAFLEDLYQQYLAHSDLLDPSWYQYFKSLETSQPAQHPSNFDKSRAPGGLLDTKVEQLIHQYRTYGHFLAKINPIALKEIEEPQELQLKTVGLSEKDLSSNVMTNGLLREKQAPLQDVLNILKSLYSSNVGFEYKHVHHSELETWIQQQIESPRKILTDEQKKLILESLNKSEILESFLHTKYVGQKRFSLEGGETLIPMLVLLIDEGVKKGIEEVVLGMAHRGRLNVLTNVLNKSYRELFCEFDENYIPESFEGAGDVKYHKGYTSEAVITHSGGKVKITLVPNPSHLESVDAVAEGLTRAKQKIKEDRQREKIIPVLIHGDAALSGQGVVYETLQFAQLPGYTTGGTIHFVINNQIGFTTIPRDLRSTYYCTDIAKAFNAPIFHVNAEDPEGCVWAALLALEIRQRFHCDVFVDINCYRKYGHNESDEPAFTQPLEYRIIRKKRPIRESYRDQLIQQNVIQSSEIQQLEQEFKNGLNQIHQEVEEYLKKHGCQTSLEETDTDSELLQPIHTGVPKQRLIEIARHFSDIPEHLKLHPKLAHLIKERLHVISEGKAIDWGMAETLAYGSLVWEGKSIRISGQDSARGTFSHRHAIWVDQEEENEYVPLAHLKEGQGTFEVFNSSLSEMGVLGFEYGYSLGFEQGLTIWEAQFGDFSNGAQVIIDQYIASGEQKWGQHSGLTLFLPHGYEGQGPEHSSGRIERFLSLASQDNIQVVYPTTPAQFFHLLRRQTLRPLRKPLVVFTPKGLLRYPKCVSSLHDLEDSTFQEILDDAVSNLEDISTLVFCSGRIYYDLIEERIKRNRKDIAIIRIEQLYPLHQQRLKDIILKYPNVQEYVWAQEEHQNMGAWLFIYPYLKELLPADKPFSYRGRDRSATPATGSHARHKQEYDNLMNQVYV